MTEKLSRSLEDYLSTIYNLIAERKVARVKDIARIRKVKPGSVSPAMVKLAKAGLIVYAQREFIDLSPAGTKVAERIVHRHKVIVEFLVSILKIEPNEAEKQACVIEHGLNGQAVDRLSCLVSYLKSERPGGCFDATFVVTGDGSMSLFDLSVGAAGVVVNIDLSVAGGMQASQRGFGVGTSLVRVDDESSEHVSVTIGGALLRLTTDQARSVMIKPSP